MKRKVVASLMVSLGLAASLAISSFAAPADFDAAFYLAQNPDLASAIGDNPVLLAMHYDVFGRTEGRMRNVSDVTAARATQAASAGAVLTFEQFDPQWYFNTYPDVAAAIGMDPQMLYLHYTTFGYKETRAGSLANATAMRSSGRSVAGVGGPTQAAAVANPYARFHSGGRSSAPGSSGGGGGGTRSDSGNTDTSTSARR